MPIIEPSIRPPSEADSFLLQVTLGCSSNDCTFCAAYLNKPFAIKDSKEIIKDIEREARHSPDTRRVFLLDGDALAINNEKLLPILKKLDSSFPELARVSSYANGYNIVKRSDEELRALYEHKVQLVYIGLESGSQDILSRCRKRSSVNEMVEAVRKADKAKIKSSVIVLLGLGGRENSAEHVKATAEALNQMQPRYLSFVRGTPLYKQVKAGEFKELNPSELLKEAYDIISGLKLEKTIFRSNHASNYLALAGRFPHDKDVLLDQLQSALDGETGLRPEFLRGL